MMTVHGTARALGALAVCAAIAVCTVYVTKSTAQSAKQQASSNASPIYGVTIPAGYRDWSVISVGHLVDAGGKVKQLRTQLGNDIAIKAFRERKLPFPDGAIIAALHWTEVSSDDNDKVLAIGFPGAGLKSSVAGPVENIQFMVRTQRNTPRPTAGDSPTSGMANLATRRSTKPATPATCLPRIATSSSCAMRRRLEPN
jgi:hypothetical protein